MTRKIKDWDMLQHYKHRRPPWIKLHRQLLNDRNWHDLDGGAAKTLINLWLIASENDGELPDDKDLAFRLRISEKQLGRVISELSQWLIDDASKMLALCYQPAIPETETERERDRDRNGDRERDRETRAKNRRGSSRERTNSRLG